MTGPPTGRDRDGAGGDGSCPSVPIIDCLEMLALVGYFDRSDRIYLPSVCTIYDVRCVDVVDREINSNYVLMRRLLRVSYRFELLYHRGVLMRVRISNDMVTCKIVRIRNAC